MRSGTVMLAGIGIVKRVNHGNKQVICSPLTFGVPDIFGFMFNQATSNVRDQAP